MRLPILSLLVASSWLLGAPRAHAVDPSAFASGATAAQVIDQLEQARQALIADKYEDAGKIMEKVLSQAAFAELEPAIQIHGLRIAAYAATGRKDTLAAHEFFSVVTEFKDATADDWAQRAYSALLLESFPDAATSLTTIVKRWPEYLDKESEFSQELVQSAVRGLSSGKNDNEKRALLEVLFDANYKTEYGGEPSEYWRDLAEAAVARNDLPAATKYTTRITDASTLVAMRIDKRFDALVAKDPRAFDVRAAAEQEVKRLRGFVAKNPRSLGGVVQLTYALYTVGRFDDMLKTSDAAIARIAKAPAKKPAYDDLETQQSWIYNQKANALWSLGRWDDALAAMAAGAKTGEGGSPNVSQAINLGFYYDEAGKPREALAGLEGVDWAHSLSPYGRMQLQFVRYVAYLQLADSGEAEKVLSWFREHQADSKETAQGALLEGGDFDGAAALLVARLRDSSERAAALLEVQDFDLPAQTERAKESEKRRQQLLARADVAAAINEYGRREKFPIVKIGF